ncbi:hypothetical protein OESDEN_04534 [Oesophagostomum dentatum]|uniref:SXP/RAL-2 family protein Ani s 5-like cation-binding domain-containing protein n=1 Tax=Oesophagostomum dentatum TaxID=61180 RepID=A0A0B1TDA3_OESDE|nr:hypothetical protein OESDEN_04534 [Oesophagostomum dentatum]
MAESHNHMKQLEMSKEFKEMQKAFLARTRKMTAFGREYNKIILNVNLTRIEKAHKLRELYDKYPKEFGSLLSVLGMMRTDNSLSVFDALLGKKD